MERMGMDLMTNSNAHGNLNEHIASLMQYKPLSKQEVLEIGSVGRSLGQGATTFMHIQNSEGMSQSYVGENTPNPMMDVDTSTTNNPPTQTNPTGSTGTTAPSEAKKRKAMSSRSFVWDHYIKWDQETDEMREEGDEPLFKDECRCRYCRKKYCCNTKKNGTSSLNKVSAMSYLYSRLASRAIEGANR